MTVPVYVEKCVAVSSDATACTGTAWVQDTGLFPSLSIAEAQQIAQAGALLLAGAWVFKQIMRFVREM